MQQRLPLRAALLALAFALTIAACGSSDDSEAGDPASTDAGETASADTSDPSSAESETDDSGEDGDAGTDIAVGTGTVTIDGVANSGFVGECELSRANGSEPVGDVSTGELQLVVAVDNVESGPAEEMNFVATGSSGTFATAGASGRATGSIDSIAYVGDPSENAAVVEFSGTTEDGRAVVAQLGCSLFEI